MPNFEFKTINTFYDDDIARYLITEKITKKENINIHNLLKSVLINKNIDFNKVDILDLSEDEIKEIKTSADEILAEIDNYKKAYNL